MIIPFDKELAQLAVAGGTGRLLTRRGHEVIITDWNRDHDTHPIVGYEVIFPDIVDYWVNDGRITTLHTRETQFDLVLELYDEYY